MGGFIMNYEPMKEIANYLQQPEDEQNIEALEKIEDDGKFFLTFWGHYSAGKSRLINTLLKRDFLPVHVKETTASLTYIQYGEEEHGVLFHEDGSQTIVDINEIRELYEGNSTILNDLEHIEIYLNDGMLRNGLVIVDTPGVNTILQRHQDLALSAIQSAGQIIYCLGGAPSKVDEGFIQMINNGNITITFVRTKCDLINKEEEDPHEAVANELTSLADILRIPVEKISFYAVSTEESCHDWYRNIVVLRDYIYHLAGNASQELKNGCQMRLMNYQVKFCNLLEERRQYYSNILEGKENQQKEKIVECKHQIERLNSLLDKRIEKTQNDIKKSQCDAILQADKISDRNISRFSEAARRISVEDNFQKKIPEMGNLYVRKAIDEMHQVLNLYFEKIAANTSEDFADISKFAGENGAAPTYEEIEVDNSMLVQDYHDKLQKIRDTLENLKLQKQENEDAYKQLQNEYSQDDIDAAISELTKQLDAMPKQPITRYIPEEESEMARNMKNLGKMMDIALLFLPTGAIGATTKAVSATSKVAKATKLTSEVLKATNFLEKTTRTLPVIKRILPVISTANKLAHTAVGVDVANTAIKLARNASNVRKSASIMQRIKATAAKTTMYAAKAARTKQELQNQAGSPENKSIFDTFSLEYWFEKAGRSFNTPPRVVIDEEKENQRIQAISNIKSEINQRLDEKVQRRRELGLLKSKQELMDFREKEQQRCIQEVQDEYQEKLAIKQKQAKQKSFDKYRDDYELYLQQVIPATLREMTDKQCQAVSANMEFYITQRNARLKQNLENQQNILENMQEQQKQGKEKVKEEMTQCKVYLDLLKEEA